MDFQTGLVAVLLLLVLALGVAVLMLAWSRGRSPQARQGAEDGLLEHRMGELRAELERVNGLVRDLEKDRDNKFGQLTAQLKVVGEQATALNKTTGDLRQALSNSRARGQWGERMAEDVLRTAGFVEGVNYQKQQSMDGGADGGRSRPDFTFLLPGDQKLNMDVKFPLDNYLKLVDAQAEQEQERLRNSFLRDVRGRLNEVVTRDYIDPAQGTLGCVLLFIPNEQIYHFIHEQDGSLIDEALRHQVVLCSPMTLFAILAVIRQAVDNFSVERASDQIIAELSTFHRQWERFVGQLDKVSSRMDSAQKEFNTLLTTRKRQLERPLGRIDSLRRQRGLEAAPALGDGDDAVEPEEEDGAPAHGPTSSP